MPPVSIPPNSWGCIASYAMATAPLLKNSPSSSLSHWLTRSHAASLVVMSRLSGTESSMLSSTTAPDRSSSTRGVECCWTASCVWLPGIM